MNLRNKKGVVGHSAVASQPCPSGHPIEDKRFYYVLLKLPFIGDVVEFFN
jgi:hypothetical protein